MVTTRRAEALLAQLLEGTSKLAVRKLAPRQRSDDLAAEQGDLLAVVFGNESLVPLLGAYALEGLRLAVDPINKRLIPIQGLFPSLMDPTQFR